MKLQGKIIFYESGEMHRVNVAGQEILLVHNVS